MDIQKGLYPSGLKLNIEDSTEELKEEFNREIAETILGKKKIP